MPEKRKEQQGGFTLIELLVVIAIIGVLTAVLLANMVGIRERSNDTKVKNDLKQFKTALRLYYNDNQSYPGSDGNTVDCTSLAPSGDFVSGSGSIYMRGVDEAFENVNCQYTRRNGGEGFLLQADLKNSGDPDIAKSVDRCGPSAPVPSGVYFECAD